MAITNKERVGRALDILREGLYPFVEREMRSAYNVVKPCSEPFT